VFISLDASMTWGRYLRVHRLFLKASLLPKPVPCMLLVVCFNTPDCEPP
jgi:hypothetical protein